MLEFPRQPHLKIYFGIAGPPGKMPSGPLGRLVLSWGTGEGAIHPRKCPRGHPHPPQEGQGTPPPPTLLLALPAPRGVPRLLNPAVLCLAALVRGWRDPSAAGLRVSAGRCLSVGRSPLGRPPALCTHFLPLSSPVQPDGAVLLTDELCSQSPGSGAEPSCRLAGCQFFWCRFKAAHGYLSSDTCLFVLSPDPWVSHHPRCLCFLPQPCSLTRAEPGASVPGTCSL